MTRATGSLAAWALAVFACSKGEPAAMTTVDHDSVPEVTRAAWQRLAQRKVFFGHQSVGQNLVDGVRLLSRESGTNLPVVLSDRPDLIRGPAFIHAPVGMNGDPGSKARAFAEAVSHGLGEEGGVAFYKYCYLDFGPTTDVQRVFAEYRQTVDALAERYPRLTILHVTAPLTTVESFPRSLVKRLLGRVTARQVNAKRNQYNALLRRAYEDGQIFDLARWESTRPDGSRSFVLEGGDTVYVMAAEWTLDGGHLNSRGQRLLATRLLTFLDSVGERARAGSN